MDIAHFVEVITEPDTGILRDGRVATGSGAGGHAFVTAAGQCMDGNPCNQVPDNLVVYHKKFPGLITPF